MGKRSGGAKKVQKKKQMKVSKMFDCPFCNHAQSCECKLNKRENEGTIRCRICDAKYTLKTITFLTQPIDIYSAWIDECEAANQGRTTANYAGSVMEQKVRDEEEEDGDYVEGAAEEAEEAEEAEAGEDNEEDLAGEAAEEDDAEEEELSLQRKKKRVKVEHEEEEDGEGEGEGEREGEGEGEGEGDAAGEDGEDAELEEV